MIHFFEKIQNLFKKHRDQIKAVLEIFLSRVTASHTGIHYRWGKIDQFESFYSMIKGLFPRQFWHLLGKNLVKSLDTKKQPLLMKLAQLHSKTEGYPTTQEDYVRLQLYSIKDGRALAAFKFCLHLACIGRPQTLELDPQKSEP